MNRRDFLAIGAASIPATVWAQTPAAPMPPPPPAKITSSVMLWPLKGSFEDRVLAAAKAGIQSIELRDEYAAWDDAAAARVKRFVKSFDMGVDAIVALPDMEKTIAAARKLDCPQIILRDPKQDIARAIDLAQKSNLTLLLELPSADAALKQVKEADNPRLRLAFHIDAGHAIAMVKEAVDFTRIFHVDPTASNIPYKDIYQTLQKSGYSHYVALEYAPAGEPVASLARAVDAFRAALLDRSGVPSS
jgi:sugar phosphate isomerase/epimerase